ncbi:MAG: transcriptional regulator [Rhodospirillaceae bacterium]
MKTYPKKRLEAFVEAPVLSRFIALLKAEKVKGYSVLPVVSGSGGDGDWSREGSVTNAGQMIAVVCILSPEALEPLLDKMFSMLSRYIGIVSVSDCEVMRGERF